MNRQLLCAALPTMLWISGTPIVEAQEYAITDLGTLPGATFSSCWERDMNDSGDAVGQSGAHGFLWSEGQMYDLGLVAPYGVNNHGQVVGASAYGAFSWRNGRLTELNCLSGQYECRAFATNAAGQIVGDSRHPDGHWRAVAWDCQGDIYNLGTLGGAYSHAYAINNNGQIVGEAHPAAQGSHRAFLYVEGVMQELGSLPNSGHCGAYDINNFGEAVGYCHVGPFYRACLWQDGDVIDLGALPGRSSSLAFGINDHGRIVGGSDGEIGPFLWRAGVMSDLNNLIAEDAGWVLYEADAINNQGQIIGTGSHLGELRAFLLTPLCLEDLDGSTMVDTNDLAIMLGSWGVNSYYPADLNADGAVNAADLAQLLGAWGSC